MTHTAPSQHDAEEALRPHLGRLYQATDACRSAVISQGELPPYELLMGQLTATTTALAAALELLGVPTDIETARAPAYRAPEPLGYVVIATYDGEPTPDLYETDGEAIAHAIEYDRRRRDAGYLGPRYIAAALHPIADQTR